MKNKAQTITVDCLQENAETILRFYEKDIVTHVLEGQIKSKALKLLLHSSSITQLRQMKQHVYLLIFEGAW